MARILCLDIGERYIGLAISAPEGKLAVPLRVLERTASDDAIHEITEIARREHVEALVAGLPVGLGGAAGPQAQRTEAFARRVATAASLPLELWDERLSSVQAERSRRGLESGKKRRARTDDIAAAIILQSYLDRHGSA